MEDEYQRVSRLIKEIHNPNYNNELESCCKKLGEENKRLKRENKRLKEEIKEIKFQEQLEWQREWEDSLGEDI